MMEKCSGFNLINSQTGEFFPQTRLNSSSVSDPNERGNGETREMVKARLPLWSRRGRKLEPLGCGWLWLS